MGLLPKQVHIQTTTECTRGCSWCPNKSTFKSTQTMSFETLDKVLKNIKKVDFEGSIRPYLMAEPLCDSRIAKIIEKIRQKFPENNISLYSNGDKLTKELLEDMLSAGLNDLFISFYDESNKWILEAACLYSEYITLFTMWDLERNFYNRGGHVDVECPRPVKLCNWLWYKMYINWKGEAILCCSDYAFEVVMGDLKEENAGVIWENKLYQQYRLAHVWKNSKEKLLCNKCNRVKEAGNG